MELYSLSDANFLNIEKGLDAYLNSFYIKCRQVPSGIDKARTFLNFKRDFDVNLKAFLHEYGMGFLENNNAPIKITAELSPEFQKYVVYVSKFQCSQSTSLKPGYTIQGKNAEAICAFIINNWLHYFRINNKITLNTKSFRYGGDGGYDFSLGKWRFDVKHRDDGPNHGLILRDSYLDSAKDDVILLFVTNTTNIKLGSKFNDQVSSMSVEKILNYLQIQELPMALVGWITVGEYKKNKKQREGAESNGIWVMDKLKPITDLLLEIAEDQICSEGLFGIGA